MKKFKESVYKSYIKDNSVTFIDLFAGIGGFRLGFSEHGAKCVFSSEWDKFASSTYEFNFDHKPFGDITQIHESQIPKHNFLCAGFPCQAFSISGKQDGFNDARGTLFFDIARIASHVKPEILVLENVKNLVKHDEGNTLKTIYRILGDIGYVVYHKVLNSSLYGVPQARERVYFVCFRKDLGIKEYTYPEPSYEKICIQDIAEPDNMTDSFIINRKDIKLNVSNQSGEGDLLDEKKLQPIRLGIINKGGQGERIYSSSGHAITLSAYGGGIAGKTGA
jgi:DNA (cytosine-5)-methyltransferase 1